MCAATRERVPIQMLSINRREPSGRVFSSPSPSKYSWTSIDLRHPEIHPQVGAVEEPVAPARLTDTDRKLAIATSFDEIAPRRVGAIQASPYQRPAGGEAAYHERLPRTFQASIEFAKSKLLFKNRREWIEDRCLLNHRERAGSGAR